MKKVITFLGGDSQCGTTMISQSVAEKIGKKNKRTLYISASGNFGDDYFRNRDKKTIDNIKANLINGNLELYDLNQLIIENENIHLIPGIKNIFTAAYYPENSIELLLDKIRDEYEYVIIDAGFNVNSPLCISSLKNADSVYFVLTQQEKSLRRFLNVKKTVLDKLGINGTIVINKYITNISLLLSKEIERYLNIDNVYKVKYCPEGWQAEIQKKTLSFIPRFAKDVELIANDIICEVIDDNYGRGIFFRKIFKGIQLLSTKKN